ncbi:hypothetical protein SCUP234_07996 [Seiridium cupressi]
MSNLTSLGLYCPDGGSFYVCFGDATPFIGCCDIDPCGARDGSCPTSNLHAASFPADSYDSIPKEECSGSSESNWYACSETDPPFVGCCLGNPCSSGGCAAEDLVPAKLTAGSSASSTVTSSAKSSQMTQSSGDGTTQRTLTITVSGTDTRTRTASSTTVDDSGSVATVLVFSSAEASSEALQTSPAPVGAIVGGVVGGVLVLVAVLLLFWWQRRRDHRSMPGDQMTISKPGKPPSPIYPYSPHNASMTPTNPEMNDTNKSVGPSGAIYEADSIVGSPSLPHSGDWSFTTRDSRYVEPLHIGPGNTARQPRQDGFRPISELPGSEVTREEGYPTGGLRVVN